MIAAALDLGSLSEVLTPILAITTVAAAAFVGLKIGTERTLRSSNSDLRARVADLEQERTDLKADVARLDIADKEKAGEIKMLTSMVQGRVDWTAIGDQLEDHHRQALAQWKITSDHLAHIRTALEGK